MVACFQIASPSICHLGEHFGYVQVFLAFLKNMATLGWLEGATALNLTDIFSADRDLGSARRQQACSTGQDEGRKVVLANYSAGGKSMELGVLTAVV